MELPFDQRQKSRLRVTTSSGEEAAIILPRQRPLRHGDWLQDDLGATLHIQAAMETLSTVRSADPHLLARAAYHLGNRHVPLQVDPGRLSYQADYVLDAMVKELGLEVGVVSARFEPESGAYGEHAHAHDETPGDNHSRDPTGEQDETPTCEEDPDTLRDGPESDGARR